MVHSDDKNEDIILALMMGRYIQWTWRPGTQDPRTWIVIHCTCIYTIHT